MPVQHHDLKHCPSVWSCPPSRCWHAPPMRFRRAVSLNLRMWVSSDVSALSCIVYSVCAFPCLGSLYSFSSLTVTKSPLPLGFTLRWYFKLCFVRAAVSCLVIATLFTDPMLVWCVLYTLLKRATYIPHVIVPFFSKFTRMFLLDVERDLACQIVCAYYVW